MIRTKNTAFVLHGACKKKPDEGYSLKQIRQWTRTQNNILVVIIGLLLLRVDDRSVFWVIHPPNNAVVVWRNAVDVNPKTISLYKFQLSAKGKYVERKWYDELRCRAQ